MNGFPDPNAGLAVPSFVTHLECSLTGERYEAGVPQGLSKAGRPLLVRYDLDGVKRAMTAEVLAERAATMWRWRELLPVTSPDHIVSLGEGETPLLPLPATGRAGGAAPPLVKDESRLPTGSFKARGLAMAIAMAKGFGTDTVILPTNGNAGAAAAAYARAAGMKCVVLLPADTPEINVRETAMLGATVWRVDGLIDDCGAIAGRAAAENGWLDLSTLKEPYRIEGKKTMGLELVAQLGGAVPDAIFYPTGGGTGLIGMWKAFDELEAIGLTGSKRPRMYAVQASGCAPIVRAFEAGARHAERWEDASTMAAGIRVPKAVGDFLILDAVRASGGAALAVGDPAIRDAVARVAVADGMLLCPEGGATVAAWRQALKDGLVEPDEQVVLFNCATGLKYPLADRSRLLSRDALPPLSTLADGGA